MGGDKASNGQYGVLGRVQAGHLRDGHDQQRTVTSSPSMVSQERCADFDLYYSLQSTALYVEKGIGWGYQLTSQSIHTNGSSERVNAMIAGAQLRRRRMKFQ